MSLAEVYLGGVVGGRLHKVGTFPGYELHVTDRRIFGVKAPKRVSGNFSTLLTGHANVQSVDPTGKDSKFIRVLEMTKDFEVRKSEILELRITYSKLFSNGYLLIKAESKDQIKIRFAGAEARETLVALMKRFDPEAVRTS